jgi:hypothetical protein
VCIIRVSLLIGGVVGILINNGKSAMTRVQHLFIYVLCIGMFAWAFSIVKLLAFSELDVNLTMIGVWISFVWNMIASLIVLPIVWKYILCSVTVRIDDGDDTEALLSTTDDDDEETRKKKAEEDEKKKLPPLTRETFSHMARLLRYCRAEWRWYFWGFVFLIVYSCG